MKKLKRNLLIVLFCVIGCIILNFNESNATDLASVKAAGDFANGEKEYTMDNSIKEKIGIAYALTDAIKAASVSGMAEGKQALVYIPDGTYTIFEPIYISSNVYIILGDNVIINRVSKSDKIIFQLRSSITDKASNVTIDGGTLNGNSGIHNVIHINNNKNVTIKNVTIKKSSKHGISVINSTNVNIENCNISEITENGIAVESSECAIKNCTIKVSDNKSKGIYISKKSNTSIKNTDVSNGEYGIVASNSILTMSGKNVVKNNKKHGGNHDGFLHSEYRKK